ncbi:hypothetical protein [Commensalibacter communis]|uniref:hypothetical protein n=1 Tax=Commensalibacter communis TaxID=2972786 RepID=UPI00232D097F|nr:hypothetical protein [Commensalibacter communis]
MTIEIGAYYLRKIFGAKYVDQEYFLKMGMRFINTDGDSYKEMGISSFPFQSSYQFERGRLENDAFNQSKIEWKFYKIHALLKLKKRAH